MGTDIESRIRHVTAVLGPTNTGKTHLAIERMLGHQSGMIGLPLRLLAREVYDRVVNKVGAGNVALITGEEKIKPEGAKYWVSTVEAMPLDIDVDFLAVDEIQLASDPERGHVFTDRLLHTRGRAETLLLGAQTMRDVIQELIPGANFISRPRLSKLTYAGEKKVTRLPGRSAVIAFSANDVYSIAELMRRQRGGAAVVLGALSPRTRNAQVELYQSGDVDFIVATDAIGMGLNLDVDHVAFSAARKFDGQDHRDLNASELAQIAGRAGRHMNDGTFGVTGTAEPFDVELVERLETHTFEPIRVLQWRSRKFSFKSIETLLRSLREASNSPYLMRARSADDVIALENASRDQDVMALARTEDAVARLWDVCQVPDYRKISTQNHADLIVTLYKYLMSSEGEIPEDWFADQVAFGEKTDGDIDTLANRIAHTRTWTFVANQKDWLKDPEHWQKRTREVEDQLSDALHQQLMARFIDKRTSALMKGLRDKEELNAEVLDDGSIQVEDHFVGRLKGFLFLPDSQAEGIHGKAARNAAMQVLSGELAMRARRVAAAKSDAFQLSRDGHVLWNGENIARVDAGEDPLKPVFTLLVDEHISAQDKEKVEARVEEWLQETIKERLKPLVELSEADDVSGLGRGVAFRLKESFGILRRSDVAEDVKLLDQPARAQLRKYGVRFGAFNVYLPILLKPAAAELCATLWALKCAGDHALDARALPEPPRAGLTSVAANPDIADVFYKVHGYQVCGSRAVRIDILERLSDRIRPLVAYRKNGADDEAAPEGASGDGGFRITADMMSILGCSSDELGSVLESLGFRKEQRVIEVDSSCEVDVKTTEGDVAETETLQDAVEESPSQADAVPDACSDEAAHAVLCKGHNVPGPPVSIGSDGQVQSNDVPEPVVAVGETSQEDTQKFEEIWRPQRHRRRRPSGRQQRGYKKRHAHGQADVEAKSGASSVTRDRTNEKSSSSATSFQTGDTDRSQGARKSGKRHKSGQGRRKHKAHKDGGSRSNRGHAAGGKSREFHASPSRGNSVVDPDSPFAALGALKDALEKGTEEKGSK